MSRSAVENLYVIVSRTPYLYPLVPVEQLQGVAPKFFEQIDDVFGTLELEPIHGPKRRCIANTPKCASYPVQPLKRYHPSTHPVILQILHERAHYKTICPRSLNAGL